ncbi:MAG TPA: macro domain-containing protein [Candidatus Limnocylindria bacterium]|nr:macro domain-containing protein [Candidatus Limnocylindria bacterium]
MNRFIKLMLISLGMVSAFSLHGIRFKDYATVVGFDRYDVPQNVKKIGAVTTKGADKKKQRLVVAARAAVAKKKSKKKVAHTSKKKKKATGLRNFSDYGFTDVTKTIGVKDFVFEDPCGHKVKVVLLLNAKLEAQRNVDVVVNPANETLIGSAGVSLALQEAAGPELVAHIQKNIRTINAVGYRCRVGEVKVTPAFKLRKNGIRYIFHTVGPKGAHKQRTTLLQETYRNLLRQVVPTRRPDIGRNVWVTEVSAHSIAIPTISIGIFGYPAAEAAQVAVDTIVDFIHNNNCGSLREIRLPIWDQPVTRTGHGHVANQFGLDKDYFKYYRRLFEGKASNPSVWERVKALARWTVGRG